MASWAVGPHMEDSQQQWWLPEGCLFLGEPCELETSFSVLPQVGNGQNWETFCNSYWDTHTHTHTQRERQRQREQINKEWIGVHWLLTPSQTLVLVVIVINETLQTARRFLVSETYPSWSTWYTVQVHDINMWSREKVSKVGCSLMDNKLSS